MDLSSFLALGTFITAPLTHELMRKALFMSSLVAAVCGFLSSYLTLKGNGKEVELGSFLTPEERINLKQKIDDTLIKLSSPNFSRY